MEEKGGTPKKVRGKPSESINAAKKKKKRGRRMSGREGAGTGQEGAWPALHCGADGAQMCPALCGPMDCSLPGFSVHGISQGRILEWVAMPSSRGSS